MIPIKNFENYLIGEAGEVFSIRKNRLLKPSLNENGYLYTALWRDNRSSSRTVHRLVAEAYVPNPNNKPVVNHIDANRANPHKDNLEWCTQSENVQHSYNIGNKSQIKNFSVREYEWLLKQVIQENRYMTHIAKDLSVGLSRLTINMRDHAKVFGISEAYETALKMHKRERNIDANENKRRPVAMYSLSGEFLQEFPSANAAARTLGKQTAGSIHNALNPEREQSEAYGYNWKYI
jgi:hypothetical protein